MAVSVNKAEVLLKNYAILSKNVLKNKGALESAITQLTEINPEKGLEVWEKSVRDNLSAIMEDIDGSEFAFDGIGYFLITTLENGLLKIESFGRVAEKFACNDFPLGRPLREMSSQRILRRGIRPRLSDQEQQAGRGREDSDGAVRQREVRFLLHHVETGDKQLPIRGIVLSDILRHRGGCSAGRGEGVLRVLEREDRGRGAAGCSHDVRDEAVLIGES